MTTNIRDTIDAVDASANSKLWHLKLGYMSEKGMNYFYPMGNYQN
jgi:ACT domain-containing protein